jgi:sigma-B regulation protein RsbU (phosphoserine phosphatase)
VGVFFTFMPMGLISLMVPANSGPWTLIISVSVFSGLSAVAWASAFVYERHWTLLLIGPLQYLVPRYLFPWMARQGWTQGDTGLAPSQIRSILFLLAVASMVVGYVLVMRLARSLEIRNVKARAELDMASAIHRSLVPDLDLRAGGYQILGTSRASNVMGGDLIDAVNSGGRTDVMLADVSGHGVAAGIVMGMLKSSARTLLRSAPGPAKLLTDLNAVLSDLTRPDMFATMVSVKLESDGRGEIGLAGHLPAFHASRERVVAYENDALPLGIEAGERYPARTLSLAPGDTLMLITDGLIEVQDATGRELGLSAIRETFEKHVSLPLADLRDTMLGLCDRHGPQLDDQSIVLIRRT